VELSDQQQFVELAREFGAGELRPHAEAWEQAGALPEGLLGTLAQTGFLGMTIPDAYGGLGLDYDVYGAILTELAWAEPSVALAIALHEVSAHHVLRHADEAMRDAWGPRFTGGEVVLTYALHEDGAGVQLDALETTIEVAGGGAVVTGAKDWVTNGVRADRVLVFGRGPDGVATALVEPGSEGYTATPVASTMGLKASETVSVEMASVSGEPVATGGDAAHDAGLRFLLRLSLAAIANGISRAALEHAVRYASEREQFSRPLTAFGAIRDKLGGMRTRFDAAQALARSAFAAYAGGNGSATPGTDSVSASAKVTAADAALFITDEAVQIFGGYGYMRDYPVEKLMRDAHGIAVMGGSGGAMRATVADELLSETDLNR